MRLVLGVDTEMLRHQAVATPPCTVICTHTIVQRMNASKSCIQKEPTDKPGGFSFSPCVFSRKILPLLAHFTELAYGGQDSPAKSAEGNLTLDRTPLPLFGDDLYQGLRGL